MAYSFTHVDTCLPDYLTDHHNRDNELLIAVSVNGISRICEVKEECFVQLNSFDLSCRFGEFDYDKAKDAITEFFGSDYKAMDLFDHTLEYDPNDESGNDDPGVYAYFVLSED